MAAANHFSNGLDPRLHELESELAAARSRIKELESQIETDPLVDVLNRHGFEQALKRSVDYVNRYRTHAALVLLDLNDFKSFNDRFGRIAGDNVLRGVAAAITRQVRSSDIVGRLGGDEFAVLLWNLNNAEAQAKAAALEAMIAELRFFYSAEILTITASSGTAMLRWLDSVSDIVSVADRSLYFRKLRRQQALNLSPTKILRLAPMTGPKTALSV